MEHVAGDFVLFQQHRNGLPGIAGGVALAAALGVGGQGLLELIGRPR